MTPTETKSPASAKNPALLATIRAFRPADTPAVVDVLAQSMTADAISESRFVRQVLLDPNFRTEGAIVAEHDGRVIGFALALARQTPLENAPSDADRGYITLLGVAPPHQHQGVGAALLDAAHEYLRNQGRKVAMIASYAPGYFLPGVDVHAYAAALSLLKKQGYQEVYRPIAMEVPLWQLEIPQWVREKQRQREDEGVTFEPYRHDLTLPLLDFTAKEFPGDWLRVVRQTMDRILQGESPTRLFIAHHNGKVLGFSHFENERFGPIGTAPAVRGQGLGQILMYKTLDAQRQAGFRLAFFLWSDDNTAKRIYTAAGFKESRRFALMRKSL